jgi:tRNA 2-thiouridine synthesizing protein A
MEVPTITKPVTIVDSRGTMCPGPITDLFRAYRNSNIGDVIELWATDPAAKSDVESWAKRSGNEVVAINPEKDYLRIQVRILRKGTQRQG